MPEKHVIWISSKILKLCVNEADHHYPLETGGVFMGYWSDPRSAVVTKLIGPGPLAIHEPHNFEPDQEWQIKEIAGHYENSGRRETYLGDWHSHPDAKLAKLSGTDKRVLRKIIDTPAARAPNPIMAILCGKPDDWNIAICSAHLEPRPVLWDKLVIDMAELKIAGQK
jgi:integrative and conjugative element protein (TIGR02256 family)